MRRAGVSIGLRQRGRFPRLLLPAVIGLVAAFQLLDPAIPLETGETALNPHSDFIFKATGTRSCKACHAVAPEPSARPRILDNEAVRRLIAKGKGNHGPGRFADCFRCHAGGRTGTKK